MLASATRGCVVQKLLLESWFHFVSLVLLWVVVGLIPTASGTPLQVDGVKLKDAGSAARPPVNSSAACCGDVLSYQIPTLELKVVAGLRYRLELISSAGGLSDNASVTKLRLVHTNSAGTAEGEFCAIDSMVNDFGDAYTILDGTVSPLKTSHSNLNIWEEARFPFAGTFGFCYMDSIIQSDESNSLINSTPSSSSNNTSNQSALNNNSKGADSSGMSTWRFIQGVSVEVFGASVIEPPGFWCVASTDAICVMRVLPGRTTSRIRLLEPNKQCGGDDENPSPQPFQRLVSMPMYDGTVHSMGLYTSTDMAPKTFRACFCDHFEYDVRRRRASFGACRSEGVQDFPQSLGYLYVTQVSTAPYLVYPGLRFDLHIHCGSMSWPGCTASSSPRIRIIERAQNTSILVSDRCQSRFVSESHLYVGPKNCNDSSLDCALVPSVISSSLPSWHGLVLNAVRVRQIMQPYELDVCHCDDDCSEGRAWHRAGMISVWPLSVLPSMFVVGRKTNLRLWGPQGSWTSNTVMDSPTLKFIHDPYQHFDATSCGLAEQSHGALLNYDCVSPHECRQPDSTSGNGHTWKDVKFQRAGYYAICYCDYGCSMSERWQFISWHMAAGPVEIFAGTRTQGVSVYAGTTIDLTVLGEGLSHYDRLLFISGSSIACGTPAAAGMQRALVASPADPAIPSSSGPGTISSLVPAFRSGQRYIQVATTIEHQLVSGDHLNIRNITTAPGSMACPIRVIVDQFQLADSVCSEALMSRSILVLEVPTDTEMILDIELTAEECQALEISKAEWAVTSRATFHGINVMKSLRGNYAICWGRSPQRAADYTASAGTLEVVEPKNFLSMVHLTSVAPGIDAPSIISFQVGNSATYAESVGPMSFKINFRNVTRFRHAFQADSLSQPRKIARDLASQATCGLLYTEVWSDSGDGFPQPRGCYYDEDLDEYGMVFPPKAGFRAGVQYQIVMPTRLSGSLVSQHEWIVKKYATPFPRLTPQEIRRTSPETFGDVGEVANDLSCKEACAQSPHCNVALYNANIDHHCFLADFSDRMDPYVTVDSPDGRVDLTMFMVDRLNASNARLKYLGTERPNAVMDLFSMDDMLQRPFGVVEASEATVSGIAGLSPASTDPRWHLLDGLKILSSGADASEAPFVLSRANPELSFRLRAAPGSPIEAGSIVRLFLMPLTQWALPSECLVECVSHNELMTCGRCDCAALPVVTAPWQGSRNLLQIELPNEMDPISDLVMHTLQISGRHLPLPRGGFMPTRMAAQLSPPGSLNAIQPRADYALSTGSLPYAPVSATTALLMRDGNERPFAQDEGNILFLWLRLGAALRTDLRADSRLTLKLPGGYTCIEVGSSPTWLRTLQMASELSTSADAGQAQGELSASGGQWTYSANTCIFHLAPNSVIYAGSSLVLRIVVDNPTMSLTVSDRANVWQVILEGPGESPGTPITMISQIGEAALAGSRSESVGGDAAYRRSDYDSITYETSTRLFVSNVAVLGQLSETFLVPSDFWYGANDNVARIFFRTYQSSGTAPLLLQLDAPQGFGFYERCSAEDLPASYYKPVQGPYVSATFHVFRLGPERRCRAFRSLDDSHEDYFRIARVATSSPSMADTTYAFKIRILYPHVFDLSRTEMTFILTTYAGDSTRTLDRSTSMPLCDATRTDTQESFGLYRLSGGGGMLHASLGSLLPFAYTSQSTTVVVLFRLPSEFARVQGQITQLSWRILAPVTYAWDFNKEGFLYHRDDVPTVTADLPIGREPSVPQADPRNRLDFWGIHEFGEWKSGETYGFSAYIRVPTETPRHSVNEWLVEWGFDRNTLPERLVAMSSPADEVRTIFNFYIWSLGSEIQGNSNELLVLFATVTPIPSELGSLVMQAPLNFVFEAACVPVAPRIDYPPHLPIQARLDCSARGTEALQVAGLTRPVVSIRPIDRAIPPGHWAFLIACVNPPSATDLAATLNTFILTSYLEGASDGSTNSLMADVSATTDGFPVLEEMPFAEIVSDVDYKLSGRDDHPEQGSNIVFAFELRVQSRSLKGGGHILIQVCAPEGYEFLENCQARIGAGVFGRGQPYPAPYVPFEDGVQLLSCVGFLHFAQMIITPGLQPGRRYAFRLRIDQQPATTPARNDWRLSIGAEASTAILGYRLWAFDNLALAMTMTSRTNVDAPVENFVELLFSPSNSIAAQGMLFVIAPDGYKIRLNCAVRVVQLEKTTLLDGDEVPKPVCLGEQPPVNRAQIRFQSELAYIAYGETYRMTIAVTNPSSIPTYTGAWTLQSYAKATDNPEWSTLLDIGYIDSLPISDFFSMFVIRLSENIPSDALLLELNFELSLPHEIQIYDTLNIISPEGFSLAAPVADPVLEKDFRSCLHFSQLAGSNSLPVPLCAGRSFRFDFKSAHEANTVFRFQIVTRWPQLTLTVFESVFKASHVRKGVEKDDSLATGLVFLSPVIPRLLDFKLTKFGPRADAVSSIGNVRIAFKASQVAHVVVLNSRVDIGVFAKGVEFHDTAVEVTAVDQLLKEVITVPDVEQLVLVFLLTPGTNFTINMMGVKNPEVVGHVLWSLRTYSKDSRANDLASGFELPDVNEALLWINNNQLRDEMIDYDAPRAVGRIELEASTDASLQSSFFDVIDTVVSFTVSTVAATAQTGYRFLVFAPPDWQFLNQTFKADKFPQYRDLGPLNCKDVVTNRLARVYIVRLLDPVLSSAPCKMNPNLICKNELRFSLRVNTPSTPIDLERWRREGDHSWLFQIDAFDGSACGPLGDTLDPRLVYFTNDALFEGFSLKESLGSMLVTPEPGRQLARQRTSVEVTFLLRSSLQVVEGASALSAASPWGIILRLQAVRGLEFDKGCLTMVPDPDYADCQGKGSLAIVAVREQKFASGSHRLVLRVTNPAVTPLENWWTLETFVGVPMEDALQGPFELVRQRGVAEGFPILQNMALRIRPSTTQRSSSILVYIWFRPRVYVEQFGYVEIHAAQSYDIVCEPNILPISMPPGTCRSYVTTSGTQLNDVHSVVEIQLASGMSLLPNHDYEFAIHGKNPLYQPTGLGSHWGAFLLDSLRGVLQANMEVESYRLTDLGMSAVSLISSTTAPYAWNQIRLILRFEKQLVLHSISDIRIFAPLGWNLQELCTRYEDFSGGLDQRHLQLPYSWERGHHICPQERVLLLLLRQTEFIKAGTYSLLIGVYNPGHQGNENFWTVSLVSPASNLGWTPGSDKTVYKDGLRTGQRVLATATLLGISVSQRLSLGTPPPLPLPGDDFEIISSRALATNLSGFNLLLGSALVVIVTMLGICRARAA